MRLNFPKNNTVLSTNKCFTSKINSYGLGLGSCKPKDPRFNQLKSRSNQLQYKQPRVVYTEVLHTKQPKKQSFQCFRYSSAKKNNLTLNEKFINLLMKNGNKLRANRIFYDSLKILYFKNLNSLFTHQNKKVTNIHLLQKKFDYSCKKKDAAHLFSNTDSISKENLSFSRPVVYSRKHAKQVLSDTPQEVAEKLKSVLHAHKNNDKNFLLDNLAFTNANKLFTKAVANVKPSVETRNVKVSGISYPVPAVIGKHRQQILAIRWLIECATKNKKNTSVSFCECLASELYEASILSGKAKQKRDAMHKHAEYNRAYIRFKWW